MVPSPPHTHRFIDTLWTCAARTAAVTRVPPPPIQCVGGVYYKDAVHDNLSALLYRIRMEYNKQCGYKPVENVPSSPWQHQQLYTSKILP